MKLKVYETTSRPLFDLLYCWLELKTKDIIKQIEITARFVSSCFGAITIAVFVDIFCSNEYKY